MGAACLSVRLLLATPRCIQCTIISGKVNKQKHQLDDLNVDSCPRSLTKVTLNEIGGLKLTQFSAADTNGCFIDLAREFLHKEFIKETQKEVIFVLVPTHTVSA